MELEEFASICDDISSADGDNERRDIIKRTLVNSSTEDAVIFTRMLLGERYDEPERKTNVGTSLLYEAAAKAAGLSQSVVEASAEEMGKPELGIEKAYSEEGFGGGSAAFGSDLTLHDIYSSLERLPDAGGNKDRVRIMQGMFSNCDSPKEAKWIAYCIMGELSLRVGSGTVAQAVSQGFGIDRTRVDRAHALLGMMTPVVRNAKEGGELPEEPEPGMPFQPMLASKGASGTTGWFAQPKYDGARILIHSDGEGNLRFFSRNRNEVTESLPELHEALKADRSYIVDGEAVAYNPNTEEIHDNSYRKTMKRFRRTNRIEELRQEILVGVFLFDIVYLDGETLGDLQLHERTDILNGAITDIADGLVSVDQTWSDIALGTSSGNGLVQTTAFSLEQDAMYEKAINLGHEGVIVKHPESTYAYGDRSKKWRKIKPDNTVDLRVREWNVGTGENAGILGALELETSDGKYVGDVGTGFSDEFREEYDSPEKIVGKIVEIEADTLQDKLRFPRFKAIRHDKDEADSWDRVKSIFS